MPLDDAALARIAPYVSSTTDDVFALSGLPEEVIAVLFAYYSRSRDDLRTNLSRLLTDQEIDVVEGSSARPSFGLATQKARAFHEKWVVGYGHASVAEHATVHLALENVSIVASKVIEDLRLGSFTEKSTRYVVFDRNSFVDLPVLGDELGPTYRQACENLFTAYIELMPVVTKALEERIPRSPNTSDAAYAAAIRAQACDLLRGLLPAGTKTNIGLSANARALEGLLSKMFSSPLLEVRSLAAAMHRASLTVVPTLVKYAKENPYRMTLRDVVQDKLRTIYDPGPWDASATNVIGQPVRLVHHDKDAVERIALALAYEGSEPSVHVRGIVEALKHATKAEREGILRAALSRRGPHDPACRAFEATSLTFELFLDYGAYRDLQRHRMLLPSTQRLTCRLGFETPAELVDFGLSSEYARTMIDAVDIWEKIEEKFPFEAQYAVPLGFRVRTLWTLNLREAIHVVELRSAKQGHASYRRVAQAMYRTLLNVFPWLEGLIRVDLEDYALARS
jgi:thymidylate synthase ThyX